MNDHQKHVEQCIADCYAMLAELPDRPPGPNNCPGECQNYKRSPVFKSTLECIKCGNTVESTLYNAHLIKS